MMITSYLIGLPVLILCVWVTFTEAQRIYVSLIVASSYGSRLLPHLHWFLEILLTRLGENGLSRFLYVSRFHMQSTDLFLWIKSPAWLSRRSVLCQLTGVLKCGVIFAHSWFLVTFHFVLLCSFHKFCAMSFLIVVRCPSVFSNGQGDQTD